MRRFRFRLDRLLELRRSLARQVQARYGESAGAVGAIDRRIAEIHAAREEHKAQLVAGAGAPELDMRAAIMTRQFIDRSWLAIRRALVERRAAEEAAEAVRLELVEARRGVRVLELLRERRMSEWRRDAAREETRDLDDVGLRRVGAAEPF